MLTETSKSRKKILKVYVLTYKKNPVFTTQDILLCFSCMGFLLGRELASECFKLSINVHPKIIFTHLSAVM